MRNSVLLLLLISTPPLWAESGSADLSDARLSLMQDRALDIQFRGKNGFPKQLESKPLFRYDDIPRGYVDGAVWRLGKTGRPLAVVTTELHPRYGMQGTDRSNPRVVYDLLSLSDAPFSSKSNDIVWSPAGSAVTFMPIAEAPSPADSETKRLRQMKQLARRFSAVQTVTEVGTENEQLILRLLPQNIDRYVPANDEVASKPTKSDGAMFLFVAGRMPGIILLLETDGAKWQFAAGRLSAPSTLILSLDDKPVWRVPRDFGGSSEPYLATNAPAILPGE